MNLYLMIAIVIVNAIAIGIVYQFIKRVDTKQKLIIIAVSVALMYVFISITYWISGFGIEENIHERTKSFITYLFVPINVILFVPYTILQYTKQKEKKIKIEVFIKKMFTTALILLAVLVVEYFYFRSVQNNIQKIGDNVEQNIEENTTNEITNELIENQIL